MSRDVASIRQAAVVAFVHDLVDASLNRQLHAPDNAFVQDAQRCHIDGRALDLIGRSYGAEYIITRERYDMPRPDWDSWIAAHPEFRDE